LAFIIKNVIVFIKILFIFKHYVIFIKYFTYFTQMTPGTVETRCYAIPSAHIVAGGIVFFSNVQYLQPNLTNESSHGVFRQGSHSLAHSGEYSGKKLESVIF
jgi:hypothetical protein